MNERIKSLFMVINNNTVIKAESNLKDLVSELPKEIRDIRSYDYFYRKFSESNYFEFEFNKSFAFQKKEYNKGKEIT